MKRWWWLAVVFCLSMGWTLLAADTLKIAFPASDLKTLDPHYAAATNDRAVVDMVFNGLVRYRPGDITEFEPDLAASWEVSDDGRVWTFHLRPGVWVHPYPGGAAGYELTSEDVVFSLTKAADPARSAYAGEYTGMTFEALGEYTVRIVLDRAVSPVLLLPKVADYAGGFIIPKAAYQALADDFFTRPVGTGPFMFKDYEPTQRVVLTRNDNYFRGVPKLAGVEVWFVPDVNARLNGLLTGELHLIEGVREQAWVNQVKGFPGTTVDVFGPGETEVLHFNMSQSPLDNLLVRQAIAYAVSRDELIAFIGPDIAARQCAVVPPYLAGGLSCEDVAAADLLYEADRDRARQLLDQAGYPNGFSLDCYITERESYRKPFENVQAQLARVGIKLNITVVDHSSYHTLIRQDANPLIHYECWRPNADVFLTRFYHSDSIVVSGAKPDTNFSHTTDLDGLIEAGRYALDPDCQVYIWQQAQLQLLRELASYPLYISQFVFARSDRLDYGYELHSSLALYPQITELTTLE
ncbi:MAG: ABC transporter substrate-binding protein [Candidatus Bipolaricaulaceae bacterium]